MRLEHGSHKIMVKKSRIVCEIENFDFLGHNFMTNDQIVFFIGLNKAVFMKNRMIYGFIHRKNKNKDTLKLLG